MMHYSATSYQSVSICDIDTLEILPFKLVPAEDLSIDRMVWKWILQN